MRSANAYSPAWLATFGHPDDAVTQREVDFLLRVLPPPPATVLDAPCGFGRHARALAVHGYRVVGVELDPEVAAQARASGVDVRELDLRRLDDLDATFDAAVCMWASFGWWDDATNTRVLAAMARRVRPHGVVVLDLYDPAFFATREGTRTNAGVRDTKRVAGDRLQTRLEYPDGTCDEFDWRLYDERELRRMSADAGLALETLCAGFELAAAPGGRVPRMQAVLRRGEQRDAVTRHAG